MPLIEPRKHWNSRIFWALIVVSGSATASAQDTPDFSVPVHNLIWSLAIQRDRKILVGGQIDTVSGSPRENLGRLNPDGSLDPDFQPKGARDVTALAVQADGKILVGGYVTNLGGQTCTNLARLNPDGSPDSGFASPNPNDVVWAFGAQPDGKVLLGGGFTSLANGTNRYIARINADGSLDTTFNPVVDEAPFSIAVQADGRILLAGTFTSLNGNPRKGLGRLNPDGTLDPEFKPALGGNTWSMALQGDGKVLVSFPQPMAIGLTNAYVARLNSDGSLDTGFGCALRSVVHCFAEQADGKILALFAGGLVRLNPDGSLDDSFSSGINSEHVALGLRSDGLMVIAGPGVEGRKNTEPSSSVLTYAGRTATWSFGQAAPAVTWAAFDYTTNGIDWVELGVGERVPGGWQLSDLTMPTASTLRARGSVTGGYFNGSLWFMESFFGSPTIIQQPPNVVSYTGTRVQLSIYDGGSEPLAYQWFRNGVELISATNRTLIFPSLSPPDAATYTVLVTNQFGKVTSSPAAIKALPLPQIITDYGELGFTNDQFEFSVQGQPGTPIVIEWTRNFINWNSVQTNIIGNGPLHFIAPRTTNYTRLFYHVRVAD